MEKALVPVTWILSVVFIAVGILGYVIESPLLGLFQVDNVHNIIHLASGVVGLISLGMGYNAARLYLIIFGLVYGLVTLLGFVNNNDILGIIEVNQMDNYLHLCITACALFFGLASPSQQS